MNRRWTVAVWGMVSLVLLAGCQSRPFARPVAVEKIFAVAPEVAFAEVRALLEESGYRLAAVDRAAGTLEALSPIRADPPSRQASQRRVRVTVTEEAPDRTRVAILGPLLEEAEQSLHGAGAFERSWPDTAYAYFFEDLAVGLGRTPLN